MSATNRGGQRVEHDFYESPRWAVRRLLEHPDQSFIIKPKHSLSMVEMAAGRGHIIRSVNEMVPTRHVWTAIDIDKRHEKELRGVVRDRVDCVRIQDSLSFEVDSPFDVGISNPPFSIAFEFVQHWRGRAEHLYMLLRLGFLGSDERSSYLRDDEPDLYVLPDRCEFAMSVKCKAKVNCGYKIMLPLPQDRPKECPGCSGAVSIVTADSADYAWYHWHPKQTGKYRILKGTPVEERKAGHDR